MQIVKLMTKHEWINNNNNYYKKKGQVLIPIYTAIKHNFTVHYQQRSGCMFANTRISCKVKLKTLD